MSYAGKSHAHRDEKNDYNRLDERTTLEKKLDELVLEDEEEVPIDFDYISNAGDISSKEYTRGVKESRI